MNDVTIFLVVERYDSGEEGRAGSISSRYSVSSKPHVHGEAADQRNTLLGVGARKNPKEGEAERKLKGVAGSL